MFFSVELEEEKSRIVEINLCSQGGRILESKKGGVLVFVFVISVVGVISGAMINKGKIGTKDETHEYYNIAVKATVGSEGSYLSSPDFPTRNDYAMTGDISLWGDIGWYKTNNLLFKGFFYRLLRRIQNFSDFLYPGQTRG